MEKEYYKIYASTSKIALKYTYINFIFHTFLKYYLQTTSVY